MSRRNRLVCDYVSGVDKEQIWRVRGPSLGHSLVGRKFIKQLVKFDTLPQTSLVVWLA